MNKTHLQNDFIVLRASGKLLKDIAKELGISTKTAERWNAQKDISEAIKELKSKAFEELKKGYEMNQEERVKILTATIKSIDNALNEKTLQQLSPSTLLTLKLKYLKELREEENIF